MFYSVLRIIRLIILIGLLLYQLIRYMKIIYLFKNGIVVKGYIKDSKIRRIYRVNRVHDYYTHATYEYEYNGIKYVAKDKMIGTIKMDIGGVVDIYINPNKSNECLTPLEYKNRNFYLIVAIILLMIVIAILLYYI